MNLLRHRFILIALLIAVERRPTLADDPQPIGVCEVSGGRKSGATIAVRGVGRFTASGDFVLFDHTCYDLESERFSGLLVEPTTVAKNGSFGRFLQAKYGLQQSLFQVLVVGKVKCRNEPFGSASMKCILTPASWSRFEELH